MDTTSASRHIADPDTTLAEVAPTEDQRGDDWWDALIGYYEDEIDGSNIR